jgi:hypothetical protein
VSDSDTVAAEVKWPQAMVRVRRRTAIDGSKLGSENGCDCERKGRENWGERVGEETRERKRGKFVRFM